MKKVREDSEEHRWKARGGDDEMMRTIWIAEQRRMEERRATDPDADTLEEEDVDAPWISGMLLSYVRSALLCFVSLALIGSYC